MGIIMHSNISWSNNILAWAPLVILSGLILQALLLIIRHAKFAAVVNRVPGPPGVPILGSAWELLVPAEDICNTLFAMVVRYRPEPIFRFWIGFKPFFLIQQGKAAEILLRAPENVNKSDEYDLNVYLLGKGLLNSKRERWEKTRKLLNHSFHTRVLDSFVPIFNEQSQILVEKLKTVQEKSPFNVMPYISHCFMDTVCEAIMGVKMRTQENKDCDFVKSLHRMIAIYTIRVMRPWLHPTFLFNLTSYRKTEIECTKLIHNFINNVISERRKLHKQDKLNKNSEIGADICGQKRRLATLDLLLEGEIDGKSLSDIGIRDEILVFAAAGFETGASSVCWILHLLGHAPEIQKKVQEELDVVLGETDRSVTLDDLPKLKYLEAVIKEGLRLFPTIPIIGRKLDDDIIINGYTIPANTSILVFPFFVHRDPDVFPDPEKFDPERFLTDRIYTQYEYMPFSAGPRNCIGHRFAMLEEKVVLAHVLKNFNFIAHDKPQDIKYIVGPVLHSLKGISISLQKRN